VTCAILEAELLKCRHEKTLEKLLARRYKKHRTVRGMARVGSENGKGNMQREWARVEGPAGEECDVYENAPQVRVRRKEVVGEANGVLGSGPGQCGLICNRNVSRSGAAVSRRFTQLRAAPCGEFKFTDME